jgi:hypothetical protein
MKEVLTVILFVFYIFHFKSVIRGKASVTLSLIPLLQLVSYVVGYRQYLALSTCTVPHTAPNLQIPAPIGTTTLQRRFSVVGVVLPKDERTMAVGRCMVQASGTSTLLSSIR